MVALVDYRDPAGDVMHTARVRGLAYLALGRVGVAEHRGILYEGMSDGSAYVRISAVRGAVEFLNRHGRARATVQM